MHRFFEQLHNAHLKSFTVHFKVLATLHTFVNYWLLRKHSGTTQQPQVSGVVCCAQMVCGLRALACDVSLCRGRAFRL